MAVQGYAIIPATTEEAAADELTTTENMLVLKVKELERRINHFVSDEAAYGNDENDSELKEIIHYDT